MPLPEAISQFRFLVPLLMCHGPARSCIIIIIMIRGRRRRMIRMMIVVIVHSNNDT